MSEIVQAVERGGLQPLEPLEISSGMVFGQRRVPGPVHDPMEPEGAHRGSREILEEFLLRALSRPPCVVAYSGGRDSSAILAAATDVARRHGLDDPIPATLLFHAHPRSWETDWQDRTLRHLGIQNRETVQIQWELDALGQTVRDALRKHGLYWPPNAHGLVPLMRVAKGGSLLTGNGGDESFSPYRSQPMPLRSALRIRPYRRIVRYLLYTRPPAPIRLRLRYRSTLRLPWLRGSARRAVRRRFFAERRLEEGLTWDEYIERVLDSRYLELSLGIFAALSKDHDVRLMQPFLERRYIKAVTREAPSRGYGTRANAMKAQFGDLLPAEVVTRSTKAVFTEVLWGPDSQKFAEEWDGTGLDDSMIDLAKLRETWFKPRTDFRTLTPLQAAWLAADRPHRSRESPHPKVVPPQDHPEFNPPSY